MSLLWPVSPIFVKALVSRYTSRIGSWKKLTILYIYTWVESSGKCSSFFFIIIIILRQACSGFNPDIKSRCRFPNQAHKPRPCSCVIQSPGVYRLSYNITAELAYSRGSVLLHWPGEPDLYSDPLTLPKVVGNVRVKAVGV